MSGASIRWQVVERLELYSPIGLRLRDDFAAGPPLGEMTDRLDIDDGAGGWRETGIRSVRTPSGVRTYPALGRSRNPTAGPTQYRFRLDVPYPSSEPSEVVVGEPECYLPDYLATVKGIPFPAHPYDDDHPPAVIPPALQNVFLLPGPSYPFPPHVPVIRGKVVDPGGLPVAFAQVSWHGTLERTMTDRRGEFALPLRWALKGQALVVDAAQPAGVWHATGRTGSIPAGADPPLIFPAALERQHTIRLN